MAKRYYAEESLTTEWPTPWLVIDTQDPDGDADDPGFSIIAKCYVEHDATRIADALNAVDNLVKAVWPEGAPERVK